ncbi:UvrD-helicase domain-containing protein [bacterium]|nr:UvrD-helicase domain-containing protein [bacterium]
MTPDDLLKNLNDKQKKAAVHFTGPLVIIAGAGSGKTRTLTQRIAYLINHHGIAPWNILAVTFTNKAANEMKERIKNLLSSSKNQGEPTVGTFHSLCVKILRKNIHLIDYENNFTIYDSADQLVLMRHIMEDLHIDPKQINPRALLSHISSAKSELIGPKQYSGMVGNYFTERVAEVYKPYQEALKANNAMDFDDLLAKTVELFKNNPDVLDYYQEKFRFISIDEYQDTNRAQYEIVKMLAEKYRNICVIGDSDQSIYSWRGADIRNILDFEKDYPDAKVIMLEQNYRSTQIILDAAHEIIVKNRKRKDKKLWTEKKEGENIQLMVANNERHEGELIAERIREITREYESPLYKDFAILYRTNAQSRAIEEVFLRYGIPYKIVGGTKFYDRKEIKDIVAYLKVVQNPSDSISLLRIINTPTRKIGSKTIETLQNYGNTYGFSLFQSMEQVENCNDLNDGKIKLIKQFVKLIKQLQKANAEFPASEVIKHVFKFSGYKKFIMDGTPEGEARYENIAELISVASKYDLLDPEISLSVFLEEISLIADIDFMDEKDNAVVLMTVHSAKGLEFDTVFIAGLEDGIFPHSRSMLEPEELEEERRLMYVAITRAKKRLHLLHARQRMLYGEARSNAPSTFIADIPEKYMTIFGQPRKHLSIGTIGNKPVPIEDISPHVDVKDGDKVVHTSFGEGIVVNVEGEVATVAFKDENVGIKRLALSVAPLIKIES